MPHQELIVNGQRIPSVSEWLDVMDKSWLRGWYAREELKRCIAEVAPFPEQLADPVLTKKALKALLASWRKRLNEKKYAADSVSQESRDIGTEFHNAVENIFRDEPYSVRPTSAEMIHEFLRFKDDWALAPVRPDGLEVHVVSKRYVYQGTFDFLGTDNKIAGLCLADWKTSSKIDDTYGLQIALYAYAYGEQMGWSEKETWEKITHGLTVRLDKRTGQLEHKVYQDLPYLFRVAVALREPYDFRNKVGAWEQEDIYGTDPD